MPGFWSVSGIIGYTADPAQTAPGAYQAIHLLGVDYRLGEAGIQNKAARFSIHTGLYNDHVIDQAKRYLLEVVALWKYSMAAERSKY